MEQIKEELKGGDYSNYLVALDSDVSYSVNFVDKDGKLNEFDKISSENLVLILNALATLMRLQMDTKILHKGDEIVIGDLNFTFFRRYIKIDENSFKITIIYDLTY